MVDLLPAFRSHYGRSPDATLYHYPDAHWNARGHALAADVAVDTLNEVMTDALESHPRRSDSAP